MNNPASLPMIIIAGGIAWNISCAVVSARLSKGYDFSPPTSFWLRQGGWIGFALAIISAVIVFFLQVF